MIASYEDNFGYWEIDSPQETFLCARPETKRSCRLPTLPPAGQVIAHQNRMRCLHLGP